MMNQAQQKILEERLNYGYSMKLGTYISEGFDMLQKNMGGFVGYTLLYWMILCFISFVPLVGTIGSVILGPALLVGYYIVAHRVHQNKATEFADFFKGFDYIGPLVIANLIMVGIYIAAFTPFIYIAVGSAFFSNILESTITSDPDNFPFWIFLLFIPIIYLSLAWRWAPLFIVFHGMRPWDALEMSRKLITKRWFVHLAFTIIMIVFVFLGAFAFLFGLLFAYPAILCMDYAAFADVTALNDINPEETDITDHLVD